MKSIFHTIFGVLLLAGAMPLFGSAELGVTTALSVVLPDNAGHSVPAVEFLRRFDRVFRQVGNLSAGGEVSELVIVYSERIAPGEWHFQKSAGKNAVTLVMPADYKNWHRYPLLGRAFSSALLQSRLGNRPDRPLPVAAQWIADGLWAEFVQRESDGERIFRFLWLEEMRNVVEAGGRIRFSPQNLVLSPEAKPGSVEWTLYAERARLLLDIVNHVSSKSNLLKDYVSMLANPSMTPESAFDHTIGAAAVRRLSYLAPDYAKMLPAEQHDAAVRALEVLAERALFSVHVPLSADALMARLADLQKITYRRDDGYAGQGEISDLPLLFEKYESCRDLPRRKMGEINELTVISPREFHLAFIALAGALDRIGTVPTSQATENVKNSWNELLLRVRERQQIEAELKYCEKGQLPPLWESRFSLETPMERGRVSPGIDEALDRAEAELAD